MFEYFAADTIAGILVVVLVIGWIMLPIALVGTKPLLRQLLAEQKRTNMLLEHRLPNLGPRIALHPSSEVERVEPRLSR